MEDWFEMAMKAGSAVLAGLAALAALLLSSKSQGSTSAPPNRPGPPTGGGNGRTPQTPPETPPATPPRTGKGGRAFVQSLPLKPGPAREAAILNAVRSGFIRPFQWMPVDCSRDGISCTVFVPDMAMAVGNADDFVFFSVTMLTAQMIADDLGALLTTKRICDRAWKQANTKLNPRPQPADSKMADTDRMLAYHDAVEKERKGRGGLVRPLGKTFILMNDLAKVGGLHGKQVPGAQRTAIYGWHQLNGHPIQPPTDNAHVAGYTDYSHTLAGLVRRDCVINGVTHDLADVLTDPVLSACVSDEGPLQITRHPGVPPPVS